MLFDQAHAKCCMICVPHSSSIQGVHFDRHFVGKSLTNSSSHYSRINLCSIVYPCVPWIAVADYVSTGSSLPPHLYPLISTPSSLPPHLYPLISTPSSLPPHLYPLISTPSSLPPHLYPWHILFSDIARKEYDWPLVIKVVM